MERIDRLDNKLSIRKLNKNEKINSFDCGDADLNEFILNESVLYRKALLAVSYVVEDLTDRQVLAYFSLANDRVSLSDFGSKTEFNRFRKHRFVNEKRLKSYPASKVCRLGVDLSAKGMRIGSYLIDFIKSYFLADNKTGCRFLTVDAYADAIPFYLKNGFIPLNDEDADADTRLLYFDLATIADDELDD
ncbi:GNAT family N-acetyltransferase [Parabacteroides sp.]